MDFIVFARDMSTKKEEEVESVQSRTAIGKLTSAIMTDVVKIEL